MVRPSRPIVKNCFSVPSRREKKNTVPSRREENISRPVARNSFTVPSRREIFYLPSRPAVKKYIYRPVPSWEKLPLNFTVPSRRENLPR